jgi:integrase
MANIAIDRFIEELQANNRSEHTIKSYQQVLNKLDNYKTLDKITKPDLIQFFKKYEGADSSRQLYQVIIKKYFNEIGKPEIVKWIDITKPKETLRPEDILTPDDVNLLIEHTDSHYFKAIIAFVYETGCRISEAKKLRWKDLIDTTDGMIVSIPTQKTASGYRKVILPFSSQYLKNLKLFSYAKDEDIIFHFSYDWENMELHSITKRAGITKPVTYHKLRHAQATQLVKEGMQEALIRKKLGWSATSTMISRYQHLNDEDVVNATLEIKGKKRPEPKPREELKEAKPLSITEAAGKLFALEEENAELRAKMDGFEKMIEEQIQKRIEARVSEILKKG